MGVYVIDKYNICVFGFYFILEVQVHGVSPKNKLVTNTCYPHKVSKGSLRIETSLNAVDGTKVTLA